MHVSVQGGTRAGWRRVTQAIKLDWKCHNCASRNRYFWTKCPNCGNPRP